MRTKWVIALATAILVLVGSVLTANAEEAKGSIKGSIKNMTAGGGSVAGLDVNLLMFTAEEQKIAQTTKTDEKGSFEFNGLETSSAFTYLVHIQYKGVDYGSEPLSFPADKTDLAIEVQCFEPTTSADTITSPARHYLLEPDPQGVNVTEIVILRNSTDKTYVGANEIQQGIRETLRFVIPEGADELSYGDGMTASQVFPVEGGFADTWPIYPGDSQRIFSYRIPAKGGTANFTTKVTLAAEKVSVLAPDIGTNITVSNLPDRSNPTVQGEKYLLLSGQNIAPGTELNFKIDRLHSAQPAINPIPLAGGIGVVLVTVIGLVLFVRSKRRSKESVAAGTMKPTAEAAARSTVEKRASKKITAPDVAAVELPEAEPAISETEELEKEKRELISAIARLDDQFESQQIGAEEYNRLRAEKKRRLVEVVERQKELTAEG